jgi:hypothetical protein
MFFQKQSQKQVGAAHVIRFAPQLIYIISLIAYLI